MATVSDAYLMADALTDIEAEVGGSFTHGGTTYPAVIGTRTEGKTLGDGSFALDGGIQIVCRKSLFSTIPVSKELVTISSRQFRIDTVDIAPDDSLLVINCVDDTRGV